MIRVVLAEDEALTRRGYRRLIERQPNLRVVGEAGDGVHALELVKRLRPNVLLLDLDLPGMLGADVLVNVRAARLGTRVLVLTRTASVAAVKMVMRLGATGFLSKSCEEDELLQALAVVATGQRYVGHDVPRPTKLPAPMPTLRPTQIEEESELSEPTLPNITPRERETLNLLRQGRTSAQIAEVMGVSARTIAVYRRRLRTKFGARNTVDLLQRSQGLRLEVQDLPGD